MNDNRTDIIRFQNVSKQYNGKIVLESISLSIKEGDFVVLIGKSGCGKTTFLKLINGLLSPESGRTFVFGSDISKVDQIDLRRKIGYVIQSAGLFPHMSVRANIEYVPHLFRKKPDTVIEPEDLMKLVSLDENLLNRYPGELSGGQKQRVGIARALAAMPRLMLMDEPFGAVDEITRKQLQDNILRIYKEFHLTIVFVTHDIHEALKLAGKIAIFEDHKIIQYDTPQKILEEPADDFVRELFQEKR